MQKAPFETIDNDAMEVAIDILAQAFHDDPVMNWACNEPDDLRAFFRISLPPFIPQGLTYIDEQRRGAASWQGPDQRLHWPITFSTVAKVLRLGGVRAAYRLAIAGAKTERFHPTQAHYYLFAIGVVPEAKGQGLGSALISQVLRNCDEEGVPAYLENSKEENIDFYEGHGFEIMREVNITSSAPPLWLMWREPREPKL